MPLKETIKGFTMILNGRLILLAALSLAYSSVAVCMCIMYQVDGSVCADDCASFMINELAVAGELDHLPEVAFYMVGPIEEVIEKAERLAEQQS